MAHTPDFNFGYVLPSVLSFCLSQYIVVKGAETINQQQPTDDTRPVTSGMVIEHIVPVLTESEKIRIKQEVNDTLFQIFRKYCEPD